MSIERIKFRGKVLITFQYLDYDNKLCNAVAGEWFIADTVEKMELLWRAVIEGQIDPNTVGQWTGCKDKLGNDIYEGDILLIEIDKSGAFQGGVTTQDKVKCVYEGDGFHLITIGDTGRHTSYSVKFGGSAVNRKEVIGNVHEVTT